MASLATCPLLQATSLAFESVSFERRLIRDEDRRLPPIRDHLNVPVLARYVPPPVDPVVEVASVVLDLGHRVPGDDQIRRRRTASFDVVRVLVRHIGRSGAHLRVVRRQRRPDLVASNYAERVVRPRAHLHFEARLGGGNVLERHFPRVGREARVVLDGVRQDGRSVVARGRPLDHGVAIVALDAHHARSVRYIYTIPKTSQIDYYTIRLHDLGLFITWKPKDGSFNMPLNEFSLIPFMTARWRFA